MKFGLKIDKSDAVKAGKFLIVLIIAYIVISLILQFSGASALMQSGIAQNVSGIFNANGFETTVKENVISFMQYDIRITDLCTGLLELTVLVSAIIASLGINWKKRLIGVIGAIVAVFAFNFLRIIVSINIILENNLQAAEFAHDLFFRVFLVIVIVGFYGLWFWWATGKKKNK